MIIEKAAMYVRALSASFSFSLPKTNFWGLLVKYFDFRFFTVHTGL
jgi:hypothetical protein